VQEQIHDTAETGHFPTETAGLSEAVASAIIELGDGDEFDLRIAPVAKQLGDARVRMLAYNGSILEAAEAVVGAESLRLLTCV
jgi:hypothetical protein